METWIADAQGAPVWVVMAEPGASLASEIRRLLPQIRGIVGDDRRVLVGFDRGGWSPALFAEMIAAGFDVLTWRKGPTPDVAAELFAEHTHTDEHGVKHTWTLADTTVRLPLDEHDPDAGTVTLRQVSKLDPGTGRQVHILTSRTDLTPGQVCFRMGARWREENYFRYGRMHFALDSHDSYTVADDDPDRSVPNPAKKKAHHAVQAARARLARAQTRRDEQLLALRSPAPGTAAVITNQTHDAITAPVHAARAELDAAVAAHRATPTRLPLGQVRPGQQILDTETKLLTHAIRMAAFNTQTTLARTITTCNRLPQGRQRGPRPGPHRPGRHRRHRTDRRETAHPPRPVAHPSGHRRPRPAVHRPQRHRRRVPRHRPTTTLFGQTAPLTIHELSPHVRSPDTGPDVTAASHHHGRIGVCLIDRDAEGNLRKAAR